MIIFIILYINFVINIIKNIYKRKIYIEILSSEIKFSTETDEKDYKLILLNLDRCQYRNKKAQNIFDSFHSSLLFHCYFRNKLSFWIVEKSI